MDAGRHKADAAHGLGFLHQSSAYVIINSINQIELNPSSLSVFLKKNMNASSPYLKLNASRPSEHPSVRRENMSKLLGRIMGCKYKTSSWPLLLCTVVP